jgi:hypothetical protein
MRFVALAVPLTILTSCSSASQTSQDAGSTADAAGIDAGMDASTSADGGGIAAIPLSSCRPNVYAAQMTIGEGQSFSLLLDTGSTTLGVAAAGCASCTTAGVSSLYQPGATAVDQHMAAMEGFGSGTMPSSGWSGEIYEDWVGAQMAPQMARVKLVAIADENQFLVGTCGGSTPQGVIGLAPSSIEVRGTNGFLDDLVAKSGVPDMFAVRFCADAGTLWLGGFDPAFTASMPAYAPMIGDAWYSVAFPSIGALGMTIPVANGAYTEALLDTGSSNVSLPPAAFNALTSALEASPGFTQVFGAAASGFFSSANNCARVTQTKAQLDAALPPLTLNFGSSPTISVQATATESYLVAYGGGIWCPALAPLAPSATFPGVVAHLGAPILASSVVIFDRANRRVGFAPHTPCP